LPRFSCVWIFILKIPESEELSMRKVGYIYNRYIEDRYIYFFLVRKSIKKNTLKEKATGFFDEL
jgi:hypothetical protein